MPFTQSATIELLKTEWQYTDALEGEYFRLRHSEAPNGGLYAIAQAVIEADGTIQLFDSQVLAYERGIADTLRLKKPGWATERRLAFKKLPKQQTLEEELRRLLLPGFLQAQPQDPFNFVRKSEWKIDIEVSDYIEPVSSGSTGGTTTPPSNQIATSGLLAQYKFDEAAGTTLTDSSPNGRNGTLVNSPIWSSQGLSFNGVNQYISVPDLLSGSGSFTIQTVTEFNLDSTSNRRIYAQGTGSTNNALLWGFDRELKKASLAFYANDATFSVSSTGIKLFTITFELSNRVANYYENGSKVATTTFGTNRNTLAGNPRIGAFDSSEYWDKLISYMLFYNKALSDSEVVSNYQVIKSELSNRGVNI